MAAKDNQLSSHLIESVFLTPNLVFSKPKTTFFFYIKKKYKKIKTIKTIKNLHSKKKHHPIKTADFAFSPDHLQDSHDPLELDVSQPEERRQAEWASGGPDLLCKFDEKEGPPFHPLWLDR